GGDGDAGAVAPCALESAVSHRVALREHDIATKVTLEIVREGIDGCVALGRKFFERLEHDGVEVPPQGLPELDDRRPARGCGVVSQIRAAGCQRLRLEYRLLERSAGLALRAVGPLTGQRLVEHHAQG